MTQSSITAEYQSVFHPEAQQPSDFQGERTVEQVGHAGSERVAPVAVDDKELAAGLVLRVEPHAGGQGMRRTVVGWLSRQCAEIISSLNFRRFWRGERQKNA